MSHRRPALRVTQISLVILIALSVAGCSWLRSKFSNDDRYLGSQESQPLEVPPGLDLPTIDPAMQVPQASGSGAVGVTSAAPAGGVVVPANAGAVTDFTMADTLDSAWSRIGLSLARIDGVTIGNRAKLLGTYEVQYQGQAFLLRAQPDGESIRVTAIGADGQPLTTGPATVLLGLLKQRLLG